MSAWTKGPWRRCTLESRGTYGHEWIDSDAGSHIADCGNLGKPTTHGMIGRPELEEIAANARLISQSPDMAELVQMVAKSSMGSSSPRTGESSIGWQRGDGVDAHDVVTLARSILAKIEGDGE